MTFAFKLMILCILTIILSFVFCKYSSKSFQLTFCRLYDAFNEFSINFTFFVTIVNIERIEWTVLHIMKFMQIVERSCRLLYLYTANVTKSRRAIFLLMLVYKELLEMSLSLYFSTVNKITSWSTFVFAFSFICQFLMWLCIFFDNNNNKFLHSYDID